MTALSCLLCWAEMFKLTFCFEKKRRAVYIELPVTVTVCLLEKY